MVTNYVVGAPGSGKSTFVSEHRQLNELVLDFDAIAYAIGSDTDDHHTTPHTPLIIEVTKRVWFQLLQIIEAQGRAGHTVWIIHAKPSAAALRQYHRRGVVHRIGTEQVEDHVNAAY